MFVGGWTVEAAGDVCQATLDQLEALRDKSLLVYGDGRYSMLETIREFAAERLTDSGEGSAIRDAHALCYARLGERAHNEIGRSLMEASPDVLRRWLPQLEHELGNIRAALRWFVDHDQSEQALRLVLAVRALWTRGGRLDLEADRWFGEAFASPGVVMPLTRAHALHQWGTLHVLEGRPAEGEPLLLESLAIYRELENTSDASRILRDIAMAAHVAGDLDRARQLYEEIETLQLEDRGFRTLVHGELGQVELWAGNLERARGLLQSAVREAAELDNARMLVMFTADLAEVDRLEGAYERAARLYAEALRLAQSVLFERWVYNCLVGLAAVAADEGRLERAGRLWGAVLQIVASEGDHLLAVNRKRYKLPLENRGETEFLGAVKDGRSLGLNDAVAYALGESA